MSQFLFSVHDGIVMGVILTLWYLFVAFNLPRWVPVTRAVTLIRNLIVLWVWFALAVSPLVPAFGDTVSTALGGKPDMSSDWAYVRPFIPTVFVLALAFTLVVAPLQAVTRGTARSRTRTARDCRALDRAGQALEDLCQRLIGFDMTVEPVENEGLGRQAWTQYQAAREAVGRGASTTAFIHIGRANDICSRLETLI